MDKVFRSLVCSTVAVFVVCALATPVSAMALDPHDEWSGQIVVPNRVTSPEAIPGEPGTVAMGPASDLFATNNSSSKGNVVTVNRPVSVETIAVYLTGVSAGTTIEWVVYQSDSVDGMYEQIASVSSIVAAGDGDFESPAIGAVLFPSTFYLLGAFWDQPVTYHVSNTQPGAPLSFDFGFGTATYHERMGAFSSFPGPATFVGTGGSTLAPYRQTYLLRAVEVAELNPTADLSSSNALAKGNMIDVPEPMTLQTVGLYLTGVPAGTNLYWAVYRGTDLDGIFQKVWEETSTTALGGDGYFDSPAAMVTLEPHWYYWLAGHYDQPCTHHYSNTQPLPSLDFHTGFGVLTYRSRELPFSGIPGPPTFVGNLNPSPPYQQRYVVRPGAAATPGKNSDTSTTGESSCKVNTLSVSTPQNLEAIEFYLTAVQDNTTLYWFVYESSSIDGTYTKVWETSRTVTETRGYFSSGPVMVDLVPGMYYAIGGYWDQPVTYWYSNTLPGGPLDFPLDNGTLTYHNRMGAFSTLPPPPTFPGGSSTSNSPYWQRYVFSGSLSSIFYDGFDIGDTSIWTVTAP